MIFTSFRFPDYHEFHSRVAVRKYSLAEAPWPNKETNKMMLVTASREEPRDEGKDEGAVDSEQERLKGTVSAAFRCLDDQGVGLGSGLETGRGKDARSRTTAFETLLAATKSVLQ